MPKEFSYAAFELAATDTNRVSLIDFTIPDVDLIWASHLEYQNHPENATIIDDFLSKNLLLFPLKAACSMMVADRNVSFIEEYIFPQQLLLWVRGNKKYDGIAYRTCSAINRAKEWNYFNVVMPAKELKNGYCQRLNNIFKVTEPVKIEVRNVLKTYGTQMQEVEKFLKNLESKYYHGHSFYPYREIISLCKTFLHFYDLLTHDNYKNSEAIYQAMDTLNLLSNVVTDNTSAIKSKSLVEAQKTHPDFDSNEFDTEFDEIMQEFTNRVKPALFEFWSYVSRLSRNSSIDYSTYDYIF